MVNAVMQPSRMLSCSTKCVRITFWLHCILGAGFALQAFAYVKWRSAIVKQCVIIALNININDTVHSSCTLKYHTNSTGDPPFEWPIHEQNSAVPRIESCARPFNGWVGYCSSALMKRDVYATQLENAIFSCDYMWFILLCDMPSGPVANNRKVRRQLFRR